MIVRLAVSTEMRRKSQLLAVDVMCCRGWADGAYAIFHRAQGLSHTSSCLLITPDGEGGFASGRAGTVQCSGWGMNKSNVRWRNADAEMRGTKGARVRCEKLKRGCAVLLLVDG